MSCISDDSEIAGLTPPPCPPKPWARGNGSSSSSVKRFSPSNLLEERPSSEHNDGASSVSSSTSFSSGEFSIPEKQHPRGKTARLVARARVGYEVDSPLHLNFVAGQIIEILSERPQTIEADGTILWHGRAISDGKEKIGLFPAVHVALVKPKEPNMCGLDRLCRGGPQIPKKYVELEKKCTKMFYALHELVFTEMNHVADLTLVAEIFIRPFEAAFDSALTRQVFSDWFPLLRVHEQVLLKLVETLPTAAELSERFETIASDPTVQQNIHSSKGPRQSVEKTEALDITSKTGSHLITSSERKKIGADLSVLDHIHRTHLSDFVYMDNAQIEYWETTLKTICEAMCDVMIEMSDWLKLCIPCVVNQPTACKALAKGGARSQMSPKEYIEKKEYEEREKLNHANLASFLIKPMQRITKYPLLMREILKRAQHAKSREAFEKISSVATQVNEMMRQHQGADHSKKIAELCFQLRPRETVDRLELLANSGCRKLYRHGKVAFQTLTTGVSGQQASMAPPMSKLAKTGEISTASCFGMLFSTVLLLTTRSGSTWKAKTRYHIVKTIQVANIVSVEATDGCVAIRTACSILLLTPLEDEAVEWLVDVQSCMRVVAADLERREVAEAQKRKRKGFPPPPLPPRATELEQRNFTSLSETHKKFTAAS